MVSCPAVAGEQNLQSDLLLLILANRRKESSPICLTAGCSQHNRSSKAWQVICLYYKNVCHIIREKYYCSIAVVSSVQAKYQKYWDHVKDKIVKWKSTLQSISWKAWQVPPFISK